MTESELPEDKKSKKLKKKKEGSKSVETMFRTTLASHIQLSSMADQKAGLLISVNAIIVSIMVSFLLGELAITPRLLIPACLLLLVCLSTITVAIMAAKPSIKEKGTQAVEELDLLFFGDYTALSLTDYTTAMKALIANDGALQEHLIANIYAQGRVLKRKYKLLNIAYIIFMIGFPIVAVLYPLVYVGLF
jgi:Family of unknown function (DUF5706)